MPQKKNGPVYNELRQEYQIKSEWSGINKFGLQMPC